MELKRGIWSICVYLVNGERAKEDMVETQAKSLSAEESQYIWENREASPTPPKNNKVWFFQKQNYILGGKETIKDNC